MLRTFVLNAHLTFDPLNYCITRLLFQAFHYKFGTLKIKKKGDFLGFHFGFSWDNSSFAIRILVSLGMVSVFLFDTFHCYFGQKWRFFTHVNLTKLKTTTLLYTNTIPWNLFSLGLVCQIVISIFKIQFNSYGILAINRGSFFGKLSRLWILNL
jgi:hypothetical protein